MTPVAMKVTRAGQISIPAEIRHRWKVQRVLVIDHGDRVEVRPIEDDLIAALEGKYKGLGTMTTDEMRAEARREEREAERRRMAQ
jgi:AbrB family looped-hinge helix DNA binding protein